jgi:hypothetical protein
MRPRVLQIRASVCQLCDFIALRNSPRPGFALYTNHSRDLTTTRRTLSQKRQTTFEPCAGHPGSNEKLPVRRDEARISAVSVARSQGNIEEEIREVISLRDKLVSSSSIPTEQEIQKALTYCEVVADDLIDLVHQLLDNKDGSAASALLSLDERVTSKSVPKSPKLSTATQKYIDLLSNVAHSVLLHPTVFITPNLLQQYVNLQSRLKKPETFPSIFKLYASKPMPEEGSSPIKYKHQNPNKVANAVNIDVADKALQCAIETKQLQVAMEIVESTYATKAFRRNKFTRKGLIPATGLAVAPVAAYALASQLSTYQSTMEPGMATNIAFAGILAYVGFTATIGVVAVTTANDQMDRVTWNPGMPLRERWIREEERAAIDRIAGAWGFRETWRRGEEEGEEWEALREWVGRKGMILDRTELMEGME